MSRYLLDTNIISDAIRRPDGRVAGQIIVVGAANVFTSIIVAAELRFWVAKGSSALFAHRIESLLERLNVAPFEVPADLTYGELRAVLESTGKPIGSNDLLIAAHALALDAILVTDNTREFERVPGLKIENWLRD